MPKGMQAIYSNSFSGGVGTINFNNIPQTYTDLKILVSQRNSSGGAYEPLAFRFGSGDAVYSSTAVFGDGSAAQSARVGAANGYLSYNGGLAVTGGTATANTFGIYEVYIPNYTGTQFKQFTIDAVTENVGAAHCDLGAGLFLSNSPITFLQVGGYTAQPVTGTSISIYGISR